MLTTKDSTQVRRARRHVKSTEQLLRLVQVQHELAKHELQLRLLWQAKDRSAAPGHEVGGRQVTPANANGLEKHH